MGKLITILGGCLVAAGGVAYGVYTYTEQASERHLASGCAAKVSACPSAGACPLNTSAGDVEGGCSMMVAASADHGCCASAVATQCPAEAAEHAGADAVAAAALLVGGK